MSAIMRGADHEDQLRALSLWRPWPWLTRVFAAPIPGPGRQVVPGRRLGETQRDSATTSLRALSLWRPWPWLILQAGKDVENRSWATRYRGPLILHAGNTIDPRPAVGFAELRGRPDAAEAALTRGFIGVVEVVDVHPAHDCRTRHGNQLCSPWAARDGWHWRLANPRAFAAPIPGPGRQRLFAPPQKALQAATSILQAAHD